MDLKSVESAVQIISTHTHIHTLAYLDHQTPSQLFLQFGTTAFVSICRSNAQ